VSKYYFLSIIQTFASLLAREMSYKVIYKVFYAKGMFEKYISKTIFVNLISLNLKELFPNPISTLVHANKPFG
jgi:hypothetical protein